MATSATQSELLVTATSSGNSDAIVLPTTQSGLCVLEFTSSGAFVADLQIGPAWNDAYDNQDNKVTIDSSSGKRHVVVVAGQSYRMNVTTFNSNITMRGRPC